MADRLVHALAAGRISARDEQIHLDERETDVESIFGLRTDRGNWSKTVKLLPEAVASVRARATVAQFDEASLHVVSAQNDDLFHS